MKLIDFDKKHEIEIDGVSITFRPMDILTRNRWQMIMDDVGILRVAKKEDEDGKLLLTDLDGTELDSREFMENMLASRGDLDRILEDHIVLILHEGKQLDVGKFIRGIDTAIYWKIIAEMYSASKLAEYETKN